MDGLYRNNIEIWIKERNVSIKKNGFASVHITELIGSIPKEDWITKSIQLLEELVNLIRERRLELKLKVSLVIPLADISNKISMKIPQDFHDLINQLSSEPPALYLESLTPFSKYLPVEEYRKPLNFLLAENTSNEYYTYYREHRYRREIENEWEFARSVYVEYYPGGLLED